MKNKRNLFSKYVALLSFLASIFTLQAQQVKGPQLGVSPIEEVVAAMTLEEKASMVAGAGLNIPLATANLLGEEMKQIIPQPGSMASKTKSPIPLAAGTTIEIPRLGIPCVVFNDGPAGLRMMGGKYNCTAFPIGSLLASTWNRCLIYQTGQAFGNEVREYGVDVLLAPGMNIQRDPLCGRNFEYYSEDPLLSGKIAASMINGIQSQGVGTAVKHFVANNQETDRTSANVVVSERALREIYLKGFQIAIQEANPWTVMSSYNLVNGCYTSESEALMTNVLRREWGYKGMVMSDWISGKDFVNQVKAGNDLLMPGPYQVNTIIQAVKKGILDEKLLNRNIENILRLILKSPRFKKYQYTNSPSIQENIQISKNAATEGIILLKNDSNTLPLPINRKVALFGNASYETYIGGSGSGYVRTMYKINIGDAFNNLQYQLIDSLKEIYNTYMEENIPRQTNRLAAMLGGKKGAPEMPLEASWVEKIANEADIAFITIGRNSGENTDREIENDFNLSDTEKSNMKIVADIFHAKGKKVVAILNIGGVIETASWKNIPDAILLAWQPGIEAGNAIVDIISGEKNPSGKLAVTFPNSYADVPSARNFPGEIVTNDPIIKRKVIYKEGIYVGYRYYNTFGIPTSFPFGYGLSYTTFSYSDLKLSSNIIKDSINVKVIITNTGNIAGKEIVQLYLNAPAKEIDKPAFELKNFYKTELLNPGESQTVSFAIHIEELASFYTAHRSWIAEKGNYTVKVGASSNDIRLSESFKLKKDITVAELDKSIAPRLGINELRGRTE